MGKLWKTHRKVIGKYRKTMEKLIEMSWEKSWEISYKPWEISYKPWESHGKTDVGPQMLV